MKRYILVGIILFCSFLFTSCDDDDEETSSDEIINTETSYSPQFNWPNVDDDAWLNYQWTDSETIPTTGEEVDDYYENTEFVAEANVVFNGETVAVTGADGYIQSAISGAHVIITCSNKVKINVSGTSSNGSLKFYSTSKFMVQLNGLSLINPTGPIINNQSTKRTFINVCQGTTNSLVDGESYTDISDDEDCKACIFSEGQLIFSGSGELSVVASYKHAICSDDYVLIRPFTNINLTASNGDGIHTNEYFAINGGTLDISSVKDGIETEGEEDESGDVTNGNILLNGGSITVTTTGEKGHALKAEGNFELNGSLLQATTFGAASKAINVAGDVFLNSGKIVATVNGTGIYEEDENDVSSAAGIKCDGNLKAINAGVYLTASGLGGKGISVDGTLSVEGGRIYVNTSGAQYVYQQFDTSPKGIKAEGVITISGGTIIIKATGGSGAEGLESKDKIYISGGVLSIECYDDAVNATNLIDVSDGFLFCYSTNNDAIDSGTDDADAQGLLTVSGGFVYAIGTTAPEAGFDCDQHTFTITGGTLIGLGGSSSTPTSSVCTQNVLLFGTSSLANKKLCLRNAAGNNIFVMQVPQYSSLNSSVTLLFSAPELEQGVSYSILQGGTITSGECYNGYYSEGAYTDGSTLLTFMQSSRVTAIGNTNPHP